MDEKEIRQLENKLKEGLKEAAELNKLQLENVRKIIDESVKDVVNIYSNEIRNLAIISGTVAPFSLTLLTVEKLNANSTMLLTGFSFLMLNITLAQFFIRKQSKDQDKQVSHTEIKWFFAQADQWDIENKNKDSSERVLKNFDYIEKMSELNRELGFGLINVNIQKLRLKLREYNNIVNILFASGTLAIVLSVIMNPLIKFLINTCCKIK